MLNDCVTVHHKNKPKLNVKSLIEVPCDVQDKLYYPWKNKIDVYTVMFIGYSADPTMSYVVAAKEYPGHGYHHSREFTFKQIGTIVFTSLEEASEYQKSLNKE